MTADDVGMSWSAVRAGGSYELWTSRTGVRVESERGTDMVMSRSLNLSMSDEKRKRGDKKISKDQLPGALDVAVTSQGSAELAILYLFNRYDVDLDDLHTLLLGPYSFLTKFTF